MIKKCFTNHILSILGVHSKYTKPWRCTRRWGIRLRALYSKSAITLLWLLKAICTTLTNSGNFYLLLFTNYFIDNNLIKLWKVEGGMSKPFLVLDDKITGSSSANKTLDDQDIDTEIHSKNSKWYCKTWDICSDLRQNRKKLFKLIRPTHNEWKEGKIMKMLNRTVFYTNGSKSATRTGLVIYGEQSVSFCRGVTLIRESLYTLIENQPQLLWNRGKWHPL